AAGKARAAVYPEGTVLAKHLALPAGEGTEGIRLETQLLHYERGTWRPYTYLWDEAGKDAYLVDSIGADQPLRVADAAAKGGFAERTWHAGAVNECKSCHNAESGFVLGFTPNQLNRAARGGGEGTDAGGAGQLALLAAQGIFDGPPIMADD